jgi:carbon monoxide dehydrogenase subunit G
MVFLLSMRNGDAGRSGGLKTRQSIYHSLDPEGNRKRVIWFITIATPVPAKHIPSTKIDSVANSMP